MSKKSRNRSLAKSLHQNQSATPDTLDIPGTARLNGMRSRTLRRAMSRTEVGFGDWTRELGRSLMKVPVRVARKQNHSQRNSHNGWARRAMEWAKKKAADQESAKAEKEAAPAE